MRHRLNQTTASPVNDLFGLLSHVGLEAIIDLGNEVRAACPNNYILDPKTRRPRHEEHHPKHWSINKLTLQHWCFSCHYGGSLHKLVSDLTGKDPWETARVIRKYGLSIENLTTIQPTTTFERPKGISEINLLSFPYPPTRALNYRKLNYDSLRRFDIHWNPETDGWILPIRSPDGDLWGWQEKSSDRVLNFPPRIKKSETLFGLDLIKRTYFPGKGVPVILVESPLDVAYLDTLNYPAVSSFGCLVSDVQMSLIVRDSSALILALDNDTAGIREMKRLIYRGWHREHPTYVLNYKGIKHKDVGEMTPQEIHQALEGQIIAYRWDNNLQT